MPNFIKPQRMTKVDGTNMNKVDAVVTAPQPKGSIMKSLRAKVKNALGMKKKALYMHHNSNLTQDEPQTSSATAAPNNIESIDWAQRAHDHVSEGNSYNKGTDIANDRCCTPPGDTEIIPEDSDTEAPHSKDDANIYTGQVDTTPQNSLPHDPVDTIPSENVIADSHADPSLTTTETFEQNAESLEDEVRHAAVSEPKALPITMRVQLLQNLSRLITDGSPLPKVAGSHMPSPMKPTKPDWMRHMKFENNCRAMIRHSRGSSNASTLVPESPRLQQRLFSRLIEDQTSEWVEVGPFESIYDDEGNFMEIKAAARKKVPHTEKMLLQELQEVEESNKALNYAVQGRENDLADAQDELDAKCLEVEEATRKISKLRADLSQKDKALRQEKREVRSLENQITDIEQNLLEQRESHARNKAKLEKELDQEKKRSKELEMEVMAAAMQVSFKECVSDHLRFLLDEQDPHVSAVFRGALKVKDHQVRKFQDEVSDYYKRWRAEEQGRLEDKAGFTRKIKGLEEQVAHLAATGVDWMDGLHEAEDHLANVMDRLKSKICLNEAAKMICHNNDHLRKGNKTMSHAIRALSVAIQPAYEEAAEVTQKNVRLQFRVQDLTNQILVVEGEKAKTVMENERLGMFSDMQLGCLQQKHEELLHKHGHLQRFTQRHMNNFQAEPPRTVNQNMLQEIEAQKAKLDEYANANSELFDLMREYRELALKRDPDDPFDWKWGNDYDLRALYKRKGQDIRKMFDESSRDMYQEPLQTLVSQCEQVIEEVGSEIMIHAEQHDQALGQMFNRGHT